MGSAGRWVLGLLLLLVGAVAVARTVASSDGSRAGEGGATTEISTVTTVKPKPKPAAAADVACAATCIEATEVASESITTAKLAPGSVTLSKLAFDVPNLSELTAEIEARKAA